jgi:hypothetical protein
MKGCRTSIIFLFHLILYLWGRALLMLGKHSYHWAQPGPSVFKNVPGWAPLAHTCNPSYSEGRDQEDHGSNPDLANSSRDPPSQKKAIIKKGWWSGSSGRSLTSMRPQFKPQYCQKKNVLGAKGLRTTGLNPIRLHPWWPELGPVSPAVHGCPKVKVKGAWAAPGSWGRRKEHRQTPSSHQVAAEWILAWTRGPWDNSDSRFGTKSSTHYSRWLEQGTGDLSLVRPEAFSLQCSRPPCSPLCVRPSPWSEPFWSDSSSTPHLPGHHVCKVRSRSEQFSSPAKHGMLSCSYSKLWELRCTQEKAQILDTHLMISTWWPQLIPQTSRMSQT